MGVWFLQRAPVKRLMRLLDVFDAWLALKEAEMRTGRTVVEAVEADLINAELWAITGSEEGATEVRAMALDLTKLGIRREDLEPMARHWFTRR